MNKNLSRKRKMQSRSSSSDSNISFVQSVTARMSGMLPAKLTRWFSSSCESASSNGSAPVAEATDSSSEDEAEAGLGNSPCPLPIKRMRFALAKGNHYNANDNQNNCVPEIDNVLEACSPPYDATTPPLRPAAFPRDLMSPPLRSPSADPSEDGAHRPLPATTDTPLARRRQSLFDCTSNYESETACAKTLNNTVRYPREPCFKPSLLGSPFYPGGTTYGGSSTSYISHTNIKQSKNTMLNDTCSTDDNSISNSARRVMELLEHYSSPIREAKRIPQYERNTSVHNMYDGSPYGKKSMSYKTQELYMPSIASILHLKKRSRLIDTTAAARQLIASHSSTLGLRPHQVSPRSREPSPNEPSELTTKVKSRLRRPSRGEGEMSMPAPLELPSAVLHIDMDKLPKFSFEMPPVNTQTPSKPQQFSRLETPEPLSKPTETIQTTNIKTNDWLCPTCWGASNIDVDKCVWCGCKRLPKDADNTKCSICKREETQPHCSCIPKFTKPSSTKAAELTNWTCQDCWVKNDVGTDSCVCCGFRKPGSAPAPVVAKPGNACDSLGISTKNPTDNTLQNASKLKPDTWECSTCLVRNDANRLTCICCEAGRQGVARISGNNRFNFGMNNSFKFGISHSEGTGKSSDSTDSKTKDKDPKNLSSTSFSFGIPKVVSETEKPQEVQKINISHPKSQVEMNSGNYLAVPTVDTSKESLPPPRLTFIEAQKSELNSTFTEENKTSANLLQLPTIVTTTESLPPPRFTLTETPVKALSNSRITPEKKDSANLLQLPTIVTTTESLPPPRFTLTEAPVKALSNSRITPEKKNSANILQLPTVLTTTESVLPPRVTFTVAPNKADLKSFEPDTKDSGNALQLPAVATTAMVMPTGTFTTAGTSATLSAPPATTATMFNNNPAIVTATPFQNSEPTNAASLPSLGVAAPGFSFDTPTNAQSAQPAPDKPNFSFGNNSRKTSGMFKPSFGTTDNTAKFKMAIGGAPATHTGGTGLPTNDLSSNEPNSLSSGSGLQTNNPLAAAASSIFGAAIPKENMWSVTNSNIFVTNVPTDSNNPFVTNAATNSLQNTPGFSFGRSTSFTAAAEPPAYGTTTTSAFGSNSPPAANVFRISNQNGSNQLMFSGPVQSQGAVNLFGSSVSVPAPPVAIFGPPGGPAPPAFGAPAAPAFGAPAASAFGAPATSAFGASSGSLPLFETPAHAHAPATAPTFNFGAQQPPNVFGFVQQVPQPSVQQQSGGMYSFGAVPKSSPQVQFNMGSAPSTAVRRVRKAVRRNTPR